MRLKQCSVIQHLYYLAESGEDALAVDAASYYQQIDALHATDELQEALESLQGDVRRRPVSEDLDRVDADHFVAVYRYHDTFILELMADAKRNMGWERLRQAALFHGRGSDISPTIRLYLGVYADPNVSIDDICNFCRAHLGGGKGPLPWCELDAGFFLRVDDTCYVLVSQEMREEAARVFALDVFPPLILYLQKARYQIEQHRYILGVLRGERKDPPAGLHTEDADEWERHLRISRDVEADVNDALRFLAERENSLRLIASQETREFMKRLRNLRLKYLRLTKAVSDADRMQETVRENFKYHCDLIDQQAVRQDGGLITQLRRFSKAARQAMGHEQARFNSLVERTDKVIAGLNAHVAELRDLQAQEQTRLHSIQTSLIAGMAALIGFGQLYAGLPALRNWPTELTVCSFLAAFVVPLWLADVVFNWGRANTWFDYFISAFGGGVLGLVLGLASDSLLGVDWSLQSPWPCILAMGAGGMIGGLLTWGKGWW